MSTCPLTLRGLKGSRLTHAELDNNFISLRSCVNNLASDVASNYLPLSGGSLRPHNVFEQRIPLFCPIKIGSNTAYNSINKLPIIEQAIYEYKVIKDDYVILCFGEIDIRNHIGENAEKMGITILESIKLCVDRYMLTVLELKLNTP